jgi:MSHA biogenesis protein MshM
MYLSRFGLQEFPFALNLDTAFFIDNPSAREALEMLQVALSTGEGFLKVTGEVGTGKSLLCRRLMAIVNDAFNVVFLPNPQLSPYSLYRALGRMLEVKGGAEIDKTTYLFRLVGRMMTLAKQGRPVLLLIDEAQSLPDGTLHALQLMGNMELNKHKILQIVFFGQTEFDETLKKKRFRSLRQRIAFSSRLEPMRFEGVQHYIDHRMASAGYNGPSLFDRAAVRRIYRASGGVPRLINVLCHKSLMVAFGEGAGRVTVNHAFLAIQDTESVSSLDSMMPWRRWLAPLAGSGRAAGTAILMGDPMELPHRPMNRAEPHTR